MSPSVLELRGFGVAYGARTVLDAIDLDVPGKGCTVLLGPSGTGKSTLLRTISGHNAAHPEVRTWGSCRYAAGGAQEEHRPALVAQNSRLLVSNVLENLVFNLPRRSALTRRMQIDAVTPLLEECGQQWVLDCLHHPVAERPLAHQRAIAILREAVATPDLLLVDEPTAGLAPEEAASIVELLAALARRRALFVVLHNLREARRIASHVVLIAGGRVQESGDPWQFFASPASECGRLFLATGSCPEPALASPQRVQPSEGAPSAACGPRGFAWLIPGRIAGTPWPGLIHDVDYDLELLAGVGITQLIALTEERFDPEWARPHGIACKSFPMPDMQAPSPEQAVSICRDIDLLLDQGEVVAVHCRAGMGRTGTVLAAYWLWCAGGRLDALRALEEVRRKEPGWVQSQAQVRFLEDFAQRLSTGEMGRMGAAP